MLPNPNHSATTTTPPRSNRENPLGRHYRPPVLRPERPFTHPPKTSPRTWPVLPARPWGRQHLTSGAIPLCTSAFVTSVEIGRRTPLLISQAAHAAQPAVDLFPGQEDRPILSPGF